MRLTGLCVLSICERERGMHFLELGVPFPQEVAGSISTEPTPTPHRTTRHSAHKHVGFTLGCNNQRRRACTYLSTHPSCTPRTPLCTGSLHSTTLSQPFALRRACDPSAAEAARPPSRRRRRARILSKCNVALLSLPQPSVTTPLALDPSTGWLVGIAGGCLIHSTPILSNKALGPHRSHHRRQRLSSARLLTRCSSLPSRLERSRSKLFPTWLSGRLPPPAPPALPFHPLAWSSAPVHQPPAPSITPPTPTPITHPARHQQIRPTPPMAYHRLPTSLMSARLSSADCRMPTGLMKR